MTILELDDILSKTDLGKISEELQRRGFRITNEHTLKEFPIHVVFSGFMDLPKTIRFDETKNEKYYGTIYTNCTEFKDITFITVTRYTLMTHPKYSAEYVPVEGMVFTDAPYNDEFIKDLSSVCKCDMCRQEFIKKDMCIYRDLLLCDDCFAEKWGS